MKKINEKLRLHFLLLIGCATFLFFSGMANSLKVHAQQSLLDSTSVKINGENWTFRTPPPPEFQRQVISSHPRLFITQASLPELRQKLSNSVYSSDMTRLRSNANGGSAIANALLYLLEGTTSRGIFAKNWLLTGSFANPKGMQIAGKWVEPVLVFDWVMPLLSSSEKNTILERLKTNFGYDHRTATPENPKKLSLYWNDVWARHQPLHYPILALAIAGDGIDDTWAQEVLDLAYNESPLVMGPYGATKGDGFLDMLASISLDDGGGIQAEGNPIIGAGYYGMFLHSFLPMGAWETATGQPMWARSHFFQKIPFYWAYEKSRQPSKIAKSTLEWITGIYRNIDPNAAALARWQLNKWGRSKYHLVYRLILGDMRVIPKSPQELGLPTAKYTRGGNLFVSSRSWDDNDVSLIAYSRYLDTSRYEPASGIFAIYRGQEPLAVAGYPNKIHPDIGTLSGLWIYDPNDVKGTMGQGMAYWGLGPNRAHAAYETVSKPGYLVGGPDNAVISNIYRGISTEYSKLLKAPGVRTARQTIVHIMDTNRDFIVVYNYSDVPPNLKRAWSMRLAVAPDIQGNGFSIPGMTTTVVAPNSNTMSWVGGLGNEMKSPPPEKVWYGNNKGGNTSGYSSDPVKAKTNGIGNLFVQPSSNAPEKLEFLVVMDVSNQAPVAVNRISDREAHFGGWQVSFSPDGTFNVTPPDGTNIDSTPPATPTNLKVVTF